jgi:hypothetical protein
MTPPSWKRFFEKTGATPSLHNQVFQERRGHRGTLVPYPRNPIIIFVLDLFQIFLERLVV